jgi:predicted permease
MVGQELRQACRNVWRAPRFSFAVIVTLALAAGGSGGLLSLFDALVLRELAVPEPGRLVFVFPASGEARLTMSKATLAELRRRQSVFTDICGASQGTTDVEVDGNATARRVEYMTGACYQLLGVQPLLGRLLDADDAPLAGSAAPVAVVSHRFWTTVLGGRPDVIGRTIRAQGAPTTIVGVTPPDFDGLNADEAPDLIVSTPTPFVITALGRLRPGVTLQAADAQMRALWPAVWAATNVVAPGQRPGPASTAAALRIESIARGVSLLRERYARPLATLLGLAGLLLLLACVNVGGLFLARAVARHDDIGVRMALGATRRRLAVQCAAEGVCLALAAAVLAMPLAWWISVALATTMWTGARSLTMEVTPDTWTLLAIAGGALGAGLLVSVPALAVIRRRRHGQLVTATSRTTTASAAWRRAMLVAQVAVSLVLLFCAGLFVRNLEAIRELDPGYAAAGLRWTRLELPFGQPRNADPVPYFRAALERLEALPDVTGVALATGFPTTEMRHVTGRTPFIRPDASPGDPERGAHVVAVSPGFFGIVGVPLVAGREFTWSDGTDAPGVAVISRSFESLMFPGGDAVGRAIQIAGGAPRPFTIVGVARDASPGDFRIANLPMVYLAMPQNPTTMAIPTLLVRATGDPGLAEGVRAAVESFGRHRVVGLQTIEQQRDRLLNAERVLSGVSASFAGLSLLVGGLGLYALLAYTVARRTRELGVRMALGATRAQTIGAIVREGMQLVAVGVALGVPLALFAGRAARALLFEFSPYDRVAMAAAVAALVAVALVACTLPALRASRIAPSEALRAE